MYTYKMPSANTNMFAYRKVRTLDPHADENASGTITSKEESYVISL